MKNSTSCGEPIPADDGSVRILCDGTDLPPPELDASDVRAFAFDAGGGPIAGWPVLLRPGRTSRVVGDELTDLAEEGGDVVVIGEVSHAAWVTTVAADGSIRRGTPVPMVETCCGEYWGIGPDQVAYGVMAVGNMHESGVAEKGQITALDREGLRGGWPVPFDGVGSEPAFAADGQILITVGSYAHRTTSVFAFDRGGRAASVVSDELPIQTLELKAEMDLDGCYPGSPVAPLVAPNGTTFVVSEVDTAVYALDSSLAVMRGWPTTPTTPIVKPHYADPRYEISCPSFAVPAVGPDSSLYLPLHAFDQTVGGSLVAVGPDARVRPGWPVELKRPGAEFWSVVVGPDGTVFALAIEPEAGDGSSASILAIAPDSTVLSITTIIEP